MLNCQVEKGGNWKMADLEVKTRGPALKVLQMWMPGFNDPHSHRPDPLGRPASSLPGLVVFG